MKLPTIFFGASTYVIPLIEFLQKNYELKLVVTTEQKPTDPIPDYCIANKIPYVSVSSSSDLQNTKYKILDTKSPVAILADFRLMVKKDVLDLFPKGIINIHPSLLPEYRGPTPGTTALLEGKEETGVSLMLLDTQLDHGPLIGQATEHIMPSDTSVTLYTRLFAKGALLLEEKLPLYLDGKLQPFEQDEASATYTDFLTRESGYINLDTTVISSKPLVIPSEAEESQDNEISHSVRNDRKVISSEQLNRMIRAYSPWPSIWTLVKINNQEVRIKLLPEKMVQMEGKKPVSYKDFMNGYKEGKEILQKLGLI